MERFLRGKEMRKTFYYPIIMSVIALICFVGVLILFFDAVQPPWFGLMLLIIPAITLGTVAFLALKGKLSAGKTASLTTVLSIVLLIASIFYTLMLSIWTSTTVTTDVRYYSRAYAQIEDVKDVRDVFPKSIPAEAKKIEFSYSPQFLQGGEVFKLTYTTSAEKITEWKSKLEYNAVWVGSNEKWCNENGWSSDGIDATRYQLYWDGGFNHGEICYVLIDEVSNRITFYYSKW